MDQISTSFIKRLSLLIACIFISLTTLAQAVEICNNGIDDDGDKLVDCQDPDCPECARFINCVQPNTCYMPPTWGVPTGSSDQVFGAQDLVISTNAPYTTVTIRTADNSYVNTVAVTSSGSTIVSLPLSVVMTNSSGLKQRNKGLIITSGEPVQVTYRQMPGLNQDIVPLKCQAALGYAFYAGSQTRLGIDNVPDERHFVSVMATVDNTVVTFQSPVSLDGASAFPLSVTLNAYETYLLASRLINDGANSENKSVSGVLVTATQPIVVNSGSQHTQQPYSGNRDAGIDQLVPARVTGQDYIAIHGQNTTTDADYVIVIGIENNTTVSISGPATTGAGSTVLATSSLNAGQVFTYNLPNVVNRAYAIATSKKAYAYHVSSYTYNEFGMGILPTINPCNGSKRIDFFRTSNSSNDQAIVTIPSSGTASLTFRGEPFSTYGTVIDRITAGGIPQTIINFPDASIADASTVNTLTSTERFHVGVVSNTGGGSTGNYGYYSNYEAKVEVLNPDTGQPDDFYTVAQVKTGVANKHCLQMSSCGTVNQITGIINGSLTQSATFDANNCISYTMQTSAPKCGRDTIRVGVINDLGRPGIICLEYVNSDNDLTLTGQPTDIRCNSGQTGSIDLSVTGGKAPYTYQWSNGLTTRNLTSLLAGVYSVTVTDQRSCAQQLAVSILETGPLQLEATVQNNRCAADLSGQISLTVTGGAAPYAYLWSNNATTTQLTNVAAGVYSVTVTDANGCSNLKSFTLTQPSALSIAGSTTNLSCNGGTNGAISLTVTGGLPAYQYNWSNGATTQTLTGLTSNEYSLTVTDANGCQANFGAAVSQPMPVRLSADLTDELCFANQNGTITSDVRGGTAPYSYLWNNNSTNASVYNLPAGTYSLTVTDANSCTASLTATVNQPPKFGLNVVVIPVACHGASTGAIDLTVEGATPPYRYRWSTGAATEDISGLVGGLYSLTVTDANDCVETTTINVQESPPILLTETHTDVTCFGQPTGAISITAVGGRVPFAYTWNNAATAAQLTDLSTGVYALTATDANGCSEPLSVTIGQPARLQLQLDQQSIACFGGTDGALSVVVQGGNSPYRYAWNTGATTTSISSLIAGVYSLTFTDTNACLLESRFVLFSPKAMTITHNALNNSCFGEEFGAISLHVAGGKQPYTYSWSDGRSTADNRAGLASGTYSVTVTDANKCTIEKTFVIIAPRPLSITLSQNDMSCFGPADGLVSLTITGGTAPYAYQWSNGAITKNISSLTAGPYSVTVSDDNGCNVVNSLTISEGAGISVTGSVMPTGCSGSVAQENGRITLTRFNPDWRYVLSAGTSFTGTVANFSSLPFVPTDGVITRTLANPTNPAGQPYTVRLFNATGCYGDLMVILPQIICVCQPVHVPFLLNKPRTGVRIGQQ